MTGKTSENQPQRSQRGLLRVPSVEIWGWEGQQRVFVEILINVSAFVTPGPLRVTL